MAFVEEGLWAQGIQAGYEKEVGFPAHLLRDSFPEKLALLQKVVF